MTTKPPSSHDTAMIRQVQIALIADVPNPIVEWFGSLWGSLEMKPINFYHHVTNTEIVYYKVNYHNRKELVLYYNSQDKELLCHYTNYWNLLETKFFLKDNAIVEITKMLFDNINRTDVKVVELIGAYTLESMKAMING